MTAEFDWWLLILGLVIGAGLVWLILAELPRRDEELGEAELDVEAAWIAAQLQHTDRRRDPAFVAAVLREHRAYLKLPPPEELPSDAVSDAAPAARATIWAPPAPAISPTEAATSAEPAASSSSTASPAGDAARAGPG
jgi:hypothetical protein